MITSKEGARNFSLEQSRPQVIREVEIPTATAILYDRANPWLVLVGSSAKHEGPVLPGGKIDRADLVSTDLTQCARVAALREIGEETGAKAGQITLLGVFSDRERDKRIIRAGSLAGTLVEDAVRDIGADELILGRYGVPDYLFSVPVERDDVADSAELSNLAWIDIRTLAPDSLSAGHCSHIYRFQDFLNGKQCPVE